MLHVLHSQFTMVCDIDLNPDSIFSSGVCPFSTLHGPSVSDSDLFFFGLTASFRSYIYIYTEFFPVTFLGVLSDGVKGPLFGWSKGHLEEAGISF